MPSKRTPRTSPRRPAGDAPKKKAPARAKASGAGRSAVVRRKTKEVDVEVRLDLDGTGEASAKTGIPFFDHMLEQLGKHAGIDLRVRAKGDLEVDAHHTVEDTGIAVGEAVAEALGDKRDIRRFGHAVVPLDEALLEVALDISSRPYLAHSADAKAKMIGAYDTRLTEEFMRAFSQAAGATMHVRMHAGKNPHHIVEAEFKAFARALGDAVTRAPGRGVPSTKGRL